MRNLFQLTFLFAICAVAEISNAFSFPSIPGFPGLPGLPSIPSIKPPTLCPKRSSIFGGFCPRKCTPSCRRGELCCPKGGFIPCKFTCVRPVISTTTETTTTTTTPPPICPSIHPSVLRHCTEGRTVGSRCTFTCHVGMRLSGGPSRVTCKPNGQWNSKVSSLRCVLIANFCPELHASLQSRCSKGRSLSSSCRLSCPSTHTLEGLVRGAVCQSNRKWRPSVDNARCVVKTTTTTTTEAPTTPPRMCRGFDNSVMSDCTNGRVAGSECLFSCPAGQTMSPRVRAAVCKANGEWSSKLVRFVRCRKPRPAICRPFSPALGRRCTKGVSVGSTCTLSCPENQRLQGGVTSTTCQSNRRWNPSLTGVRCVPVDSGPPTSGECPVSRPLPSSVCERLRLQTCEERCLEHQTCCPNACGGRSCVSIRKPPVTSSRCPIPRPGSCRPPQPLPKCFSPCPDGQLCCRARCGGYTCTPIPDHPTGPPTPPSCPVARPIPSRLCQSHPLPTCEERCLPGQTCCPNGCGERSCILAIPKPPVTSPRCPIPRPGFCVPPQPLLKCFSPCPDGQICCRARCGGYTCTPIPDHPTVPPPGLSRHCRITTTTCPPRNPMIPDPVCPPTCPHGTRCCISPCGGSSCRRMELI